MKLFLLTRGAIPLRLPRGQRYGVACPTLCTVMCLNFEVEVELFERTSSAESQISYQVYLKYAHTYLIRIAGTQLIMLTRYRVVLLVVCITFAIHSYLYFLQEHPVRFVFRTTRTRTWYCFLSVLYTFTALRVHVYCTASSRLLHYEYNGSLVVHGIGFSRRVPSYT